MKLQLRLANGSTKTQFLHRVLLNICILFTGIAANSIAFISLTSHEAAAIQPSHQTQSNRNLETTVLPASVLGGEVKLKCENRLNLVQPNDCSAGEGNEPLLNIPKEPIRNQPNLNNIAPERNQLTIFEVRF